MTDGGPSFRVEPEATIDGLKKSDRKQLPTVYYDRPLPLPPALNPIRTMFKSGASAFRLQIDSGLR